MSSLWHYSQQIIKPGWLGYKIFLNIYFILFFCVTKNDTGFPQT